MNNITILPMDSSDYDEVRTLWKTIKGLGIREIDDSKEAIERFIARNPGTSVVAKDKDRIIGSILCGSDGRQGTLYHVCVAKEYRRQGIAKKMVTYCIHQLKTLGINKVALIAFVENDGGNSFWKQLGWQKIEANYYEYILNKNNKTWFVNDV